MVFSSLIFLFAFLPVTLLLYYICKNRVYRNIVLFVLSLVFYGWGEPVYILVMLFSITSAYAFGILIDRNRGEKSAKVYMIISLLVNLAALLFFKYANFFISNLMLIPILSGKLAEIQGLTLPIGISFYTFQIMSYTIDLFRGDTKVQKNFIAFGTYVTLFPQLIAGPIVRYRDVDEQLSERTESFELFSSGVRRFVIGLSKKILIGDALAAVYEYCKSASELNNTMLGAWMVMIFYTLHIYYDFSGYSDMAIGLGRMFGFRFLENFDYPYISTSITEFWRRWHMSLGTWFREYVYIPLGGNRCGKLKQYRNIAVVWFLTGFWHGASWNFILWGVYFGIILMLEKTFLLKAIERLPKVLTHIYALLLIGFGWILFSFTDMSAGISCFTSLFGIGVKSVSSPVMTYSFIRSLPLLMTAIIGSTPLPKKLFTYLAGADLTAYGNLDRKGKEIAPPEAKTGMMNRVFTYLSVFVFAGLVILCTAYLVDSTFSPFLYFIF